jgi:transcriptional regulator GlxA family with amidase domain
MKTLLILALDGVMESSLGITLDTLRAGLTFCAATGKPVQRQIMVAGYDKFIRTRGNLRLATDVTFKSLRQAPKKAEWIVIPGLGLISDEAISSRFARPHVIELLAMLKKADAEGIKIAASCSAVFLLAQAGVMDGRQATMTW